MISSKSTTKTADENENVDEQPAVTGRPNDTPIVDAFVPGSTLASRKKARESREKRVDSAENKSVTSAATKGAPKKAPAKG